MDTLIAQTSFFIYGVAEFFSARTKPTLPDDLIAQPFHTYSTSNLRCDLRGIVATYAPLHYPFHAAYLSLPHTTCPHSSLHKNLRQQITPSRIAFSFGASSFPDTRREMISVATHKNYTVPRGMDTLVAQTYFNGEAGLFRAGTELCLSLPKKIAPTDSSVARILHTARPVFPMHSMFQHPPLPPEFAPADAFLVPLSRRASTFPRAQRAPTSAPLAKSRPPFAPPSDLIAPPEIQTLRARRGVPPPCKLRGAAVYCQAKRRAVFSQGAPTNR